MCFLQKPVRGRVSTAKALFFTSMGEAITSVLMRSISTGGKKTAPVKHIYECFVYVLEGHGSTVVDLPGGKRHTFEWGPRSLFAIPLNVKYQLFNGSGRDRALLACTTSLPLTMNVYHNQGFVFDNSYVFADRIGDPKYYEGDGDFISIKPGRHMWETNFVPDLTDLDLPVWNERGAGGSSLTFCLGRRVHACPRFPDSNGSLQEGSSTCRWHAYLGG